jgi:hypothetical protein
MRCFFCHESGESACFGTCILTTVCSAEFVLYPCPFRASRFCLINLRGLTAYINAYFNFELVLRLRRDVLFPYQRHVHH